MPPIALEQRLQEPLAPARALLDELAQCGRRLLACNVAVVVDDADRLAQATDADADVSIFRQVPLIPAAHTLEHLSGEEYRVAAQGGHTQPGMVVQPTLEPEEVFQYIEDRVPLRLVIHQLHPALHDRDRLV